ncbi:hypothetical protein NECAME_12894 [Necator americanus]|uniref:Uncharacterized protein n=1 Tax=Necator americanus TaxID=51031 RepID=W2SXU4_NECAM|nr:hypothetical protein NECAME_12894 [Necator americanus]ETN74584.1 hypothetical protein NECAME_12894 [Necator americanus]
MLAVNPPAKEDTWAFQKIGTKFPPNPVKVLGQQNMYVALWYKHGRPIHGRSWNNGGVVECSFPYKKAELRTAQQLEGNIQVLQYVGDHNTQGFWYEWIKYKDRFEKTEDRQMLKCGDSFPIFWKDRKQGPLLGYADNTTEVALFSCDGTVYEKKGPELNDMYIIVRNVKGGPPFCECDHCPKPAPPAPPPGQPGTCSCSGHPSGKCSGKHEGPCTEACRGHGSGHGSGTCPVHGGASGQPVPCSCPGHAPGTCPLHGGASRQPVPCSCPGYAPGTCPLHGGASAPLPPK